MHDEADQLLASDSENDARSTTTSEDSEPHSDWNWTEKDESCQSDDGLDLLMGDEELLEELEESIADCQQELISLRKYYVNLLMLQLIYTCNLFRQCSC